MAKQGNTINVSTSDHAQAVLPQREGEVRQAGEEGGHRAAVKRDAHAMTSIRFAPKLLFLSADPARVRAQLAGEALRRSERARAAARRRVHRRDHAAAGDGALRRRARPLPVHRLQGRRRAADRARRGARRRHRGGGGRPALRQGQLARAQRGGRTCGRRAAGDRRELRAHLPPERRQPRPVHQHRLRPDRAHRARRADRARRAAGRARRIGRGDRARRWPAAPTARPSCATWRCGRRSPNTTARRRARCSRRSSIATRWPRPTRRRGCAPGRGRLRARRPAFHPRVLHRHVRAHARAARSATAWRCTSRAASSPSRTICRTCTAARCTWRRG